MSDIDWASLHKLSTTVLTGDFPIAVVKATAGQSQNGKPMIKCQLKVTEGPYAGRTINHNFTITAENPNAMGFFFAAMKKLGADDAFFATGPNLDQIAAQIINRQALVTLAPNEFNGVTREQVSVWKEALGVGSFVSTAGSSSPLSGLAASALPVAQTVAPSTEPPADPF